jgi:SAM-dependent methyltransferase
LKHDAAPAVNASQPEALAARGLHSRTLGVITEFFPPEKPIDVLDIGAGRGALSYQLNDAGYRVSACDLFPEDFNVPGVECRLADADAPLPYEDASFDLVLAVELVEHIEDHHTLFNEVNRVLKPQGHFLLTTPNILTLKSRLRFLFTGYFYGFPPLEPEVRDPVSQHITAHTLDRYRWRLAQCGLELTDLRTDKYQRTSMAFGFLAPLIRFRTAREHGDSPWARQQNARVPLFGRTLIGVAQKR